MMIGPSLQPYRLLAVLLGLAVLGWQLINLRLGNPWHEYLIADVMASLFLLVMAWRGREPGLLVGFALFWGIFLAASTSKLAVGGGHPGTTAAALGIVPCLVGVIGLSRRML